MFYKHFNKKIFVLFGIPSICMTIIGASLASIIDTQILKIVLGIVLIIFSLYSLFKPNIKVAPHKWFGILGGGLSGFTAGLIGTGGVLRGAFLTLFHLPKEQYISTIAAIALLVDFTRIPLYLKAGFLDTKYLILIPLLFIIAFIGSYIGKLIIKKLSEKFLRHIILIGIILVSLILIFQNI